MKIEVALHEDLERPFLERLPGGTARVHASIKHHSEAILAVLNPLLEPGEGDLVSGIMADDSVEREFEQHPEFLLIKSI